MTKKFLRICFGFVLGVLTVMAAMVCYSKIFQANALTEEMQKTNAILKDSVQKNNVASINDLNIKVINFDEKIGSINKRFDDLYVLGGTIVVLLIAINIGIYVRTEDEVEKYFNDNFEVHHKKILDYLAKSANAVGEIDSNLAILKNIKEKDIKSQQKQTPTASV